MRIKDMVELVYSRDSEHRSDADEQALAWVVRLNSGECTTAEHEALRAWRDENPRHAEALQRARRLWTLLGAALPAAEEHLARPRSVSWLRRMAIGASIAASLLLSIDTGVHYWQTWRYDLVTPVGETREVALADGSKVMLGGDTAINIDYSHGVRRLVLGRGEALFEVRHGITQPFIVQAGRLTVRDIGTIFDIDMTGRAARVVVTAGTVEAMDEGRRVLLTEGQGVSTSATGQDLGPVRAVDAGLETSWTRGWLTMQNASLGDIVQKLSPYYDRRIVLLNSDMAKRRLTAAIELSHIGDWMEGLAKTNKVHYSQVGPFAIIW